MSNNKTCLKLLPAFMLFATLPASGEVLYSFRDARFFGGDTATRETLDSGAFTPTTSEQLPVNYSTGGGTPTLFNGNPTNQGQPFRLGVFNHVDAGADTALTFNTDFTTPTTIVSIVTSQITDTAVTVTGGSGTGYILPTFRIVGSFEDTHGTAFGQLAMCAGTVSCTLSGVANSTGPALVDTTFTPTIGASTQFAFDTPFTFFFFMLGGINSFTPGNLAPGDLTVDFADGLELLSVSVVDEFGTPIPGAVIHSEFLDGLAAVPAPGTLALLGLGLAALVSRRRNATGRV